MTEDNSTPLHLRLLNPDGEPLIPQQEKKSPQLLAADGNPFGITEPKIGTQIALLNTKPPVSEPKEIALSGNTARAAHKPAKAARGTPEEAVLIAHEIQGKVFDLPEVTRLVPKGITTGASANVAAGFVSYISTMVDIATGNGHAREGSVKTLQHQRLQLLGSSRAAEDALNVIDATIAASLGTHGYKMPRAGLKRS